ncbi:nitrate reductase [Aidingimonas halophila]|uniref:Assimilatory nitrate reductase (NADH) alpha subunit apoprotein n=1 Tax=Aidingimonas halophila TaxID=574349 RepID=A0A1H2TVM4_9GAMM|nr:nitrate reductase [Aidingimonas halophila]GHC38555.1 nitrate reductase [Aidingimonas halophila]SDW47932.1 assimilatory nitrate reductase (NADH) alpha subunit apoprotein [Aidingimonas halophila]
MHQPTDKPAPTSGQRICTTCPYCGVGCGVEVIHDGDMVTSVQGDRDHPANFGRLCVKGSALHETLGHHGRLTRPRVDGREVDWDTALDSVASRLAATRTEHGDAAVAAYLSGQLLTEDYYVANKLFKGFLGTPHLDTNSRLCMASAVAAYKRAFGADAVPCSYEDIEEAELVVLVGSNLAWNHPVLYQRLKAAKQRNPLLRVVVIDPRVTDTCEIADLYLGLKPGSDARLFNGLLAWMADKQRLDTIYLEKHTAGLDEALAAAREDDPRIEAIAADCDLDSEALETFFYWFASQLHVVTLYSQGINQSTSGTDKCNAIINCHLAGGKLGLPGAGPFSITGQPNAMGGREVGGLANQLAAHMDYHTPGAIERVTRFWTTGDLTPRLPNSPGYKAVELFNAVERGEIQAVWIMATNPAVSLPDANRVRAALAKCPLVIVSDCMADTDLMDYADIVLPATSWSEKDGTVTNSERRISRQRGMLPPPGEARHDWWIMVEVAKRLGFDAAFAYTHPGEIFDEHARLSGFENTGEGSRLFDISGLAGMDRAAYDALTPIQWPVNRAAPFGTERLFEDGHFATPTGHAALVPVRPRAPEQALSAARPLRLNTGRVRDQWHTMTRTARAPRLMNHRAEPFIEVSPADAAALGVSDQQLACLTSRTGEYCGRIRLSKGQRRGEVFIPIHWTDRFSMAARTGGLLEAHIDSLSGQPEAKHGAVSLAPLSVGWEATLLVAESLRCDTDWQEGNRYWTRIPLGHCQRLQLAGGEPGERRDWLAWVEELLPVSPSLWCDDPASGRLRAAGIEDGRLCWWLMVAPPCELPGMNWLDDRFADAQAGERLDDNQRRRLLAGCESGEADNGPLVCSCHQVGQKAIVEAIREGDASVEALGARLACGTQCGSCVPELKSLIEEESTHAHSATTPETEVA